MTRVQLIHKTLGVAMWVAETEVDKYLAAGHKLAASSVKPADDKQDEVVEEPKAEEKKTVKRSTKKK